MKQLVEQINNEMDWQWLHEQSEYVIEQAIAIQKIPGPTFHEQQRAQYVAQQFADCNLKQIEIDDLHNVYGVFPGRGKSGVMVSAHTDTVFDLETDLQIRYEDGLIYGPGIGDNSMGVAGLLGLARTLSNQSLSPSCDIWFVANSREEGLGDLGGMKAAFSRLQPHIAQVINLEGMAFGHVYHAGIAVRRLRITATAEGGHSWLNYGRASAVHGIVELGARIIALKPPLSPRTTFNIGMIDGGTTINAIATSASLWLDLRSEDSRTLAKFERLVRAQVETYNHPDLTFTIEVVGDRPAGSISTEHPLVQGALTALEIVGIQGAIENGSTDANVPLAHGTPAVTIGITRGGNAHRLDEYIETQPVMDGLRQLIALTLAVSHQNI